MRISVFILMILGSVISVLGLGSCSSRAREGSGVLLHPAELRAESPAIYDASFQTTKGVFVVQVTRAWAPHGADRFYNLVRHHFYDGASFFRVLPGFVVQFGISPNPRISRAWVNATIPDDPVVKGNLRGHVTFATGGPNTRTTQVFINLHDNTALDSEGFSAFGEVVSGMAVVDSLYSGYGEGAPQGNGPDQSMIQRDGNAYLERDFPMLDRIVTARILPARE
jgi:peptidyl-prolyl cis-trans isomerase A (cyclophilin A)